MEYPLYLVIYGPSRDYRTTYRGENSEYFSEGIVYTESEYKERLKNAEYYFCGHPNELTEYKVFLPEGNWYDMGNGYRKEELEEENEIN